MLKRNLIATAIITFGLILTSNIFAQSPREPASGQTTGKRKVRKANTGFMDYTDDACSVCDGKVKAAKNKTAQTKGVRKHKPVNSITADENLEEPPKAEKNTIKSNRRRFDHIGNIKNPTNETTRNRKPKAEKFAGTLMEGSNIKRKQPRKGKVKNKS